MLTINNNKISLIYAIVGPLVLIVIWVLVSNLNIINPVFLPPFEMVFNQIVNFLFTSGIKAISATFYRTFISLLIAGFFAIPLGLFLGYNKRAYIFSEIVIDFFRSVPATAFFPIFLLLFGVGDIAKIAICSFVVFWILLVNTIYGVWEGSEIRLKVAKIYRLSRLKMFTSIIVYDALPQIMISIRISISISLVITIVSEMFIGAQYGLGKVIYDSYVSYDTSLLYAVIIVIGLLGYAINKVFVLFEKKIVHWVGK